jgi:hypothetical protein
MPSPTPEIRDIAPPVEVFPYPLWVVIAAAILLLALLILLLWALMRWWQQRPPQPPPTPREIAAQRLADARRRLKELDPYVFSILVSDILRSYITSQFHLRATQQTSPEFLGSVSNSPRFSEEEKSLLQHFLQKSDLIKFARAEATTRDNAELLEQAANFVEGKPA